MIIFVGPYSPVGSCPSPNLGAGRKIETVVRVLSRLDNDLVFINSAHNDDVMSQPQERFCEIAGVKVRELLPTRWPSRKLGKLLNLLEVFFLARRLAKQKTPVLLWLYNGYAFESLFAKSFTSVAGCPVVLEFEDWHFARGRGFNPKPWIDYLAWRSALPVISHGVCVNDKLSQYLTQQGIGTTLLPGVVPEGLLTKTGSLQPFSVNKKVVEIGYFGGLSVEKGAQILLEAIETLEGPYRWIITGAGPLAAAFLQLSKSRPDKLDFRGAVDEHELYEVITSCDVIVNPHSPILEMNGGVFPFKVVEAIASGRLLISTPLPPLDIPELLDGIEFFSGSSESLIACIKAARQQYQVKQVLINRSREIAVDLFSEASLLDKLKKIIASS